MTTQVTKLEKKVLDQIQIFTAEHFSSDEGNWAYIDEIAEEIDSKILRGLLSSLLQKGILFIDYDSDFVAITSNFFRETGGTTPAGSPEIEFTNIEVK